MSLTPKPQNPSILYIFKILILPIFPTLNTPPLIFCGGTEFRSKGGKIKGGQKSKGGKSNGGNSEPSGQIGQFLPRLCTIENSATANEVATDQSGGVPQAQSQPVGQMCQRRHHQCVRSRKKLPNLVINIENVQTSTFVRRI